MLRDYVLIYMRIIDRSSEILREEGLISFVYSVKQYLLRRVRSVYYELGSGRVCPICGWEGSQFLPFGVEQRPDSACPDCGSKERHRLMWEYLSREYPFHNGTDVLYFAPVDGLEQKLRNKIPINLTTTDLQQQDVNIPADIAELPFVDGSFDLIICSHVLEHVPNDYQALKELYRVLQTDGEAIILVPQDRERKETYNDPTITSERGRKKAFGQADHVRWYGTDVEEKISSAGFVVSTIDYLSQFDESYTNKYRLRESDKWIHSPSRIFRCSKPE